MEYANQLQNKRVAYEIEKDDHIVFYIAYSPELADVYSDAFFRLSNQDAEVAIVAFHNNDDIMYGGKGEAANESGDMEITMPYRLFYSRANYLNNELSKRFRQAPSASSSYNLFSALLENARSWIQPTDVSASIVPAKSENSSNQMGSPTLSESIDLTGPAHTDVEATHATLVPNVPTSPTPFMAYNNGAQESVEPTMASPESSLLVESSKGPSISTNVDTTIEDDSIGNEEPVEMEEMEKMEEQEKSVEREGDEEEEEEGDEEEEEEEEGEGEEEHEEMEYRKTPIQEPIAMVPTPKGYLFQITIKKKDQSIQDLHTPNVYTGPRLRIPDVVLLEKEILYFEEHAPTRKIQYMYARHGVRMVA